MKLSQFSVSKIITTAILALPIIAFAGDLKITNNAKEDFVFKTNFLYGNNGVCSTTLPLLKSGQSITISEDVLKKECGEHSSKCDMDFYNIAKDPNCGHYPNAMANISVNSGIVDYSSTKYIISGSGFDIKISHH